MEWTPRQVAQRGGRGPYLSNGALYCTLNKYRYVGGVASSAIRIYKSTNGGASWSVLHEIDQAVTSVAEDSTPDVDVSDFQQAAASNLLFLAYPYEPVTDPDTGLSTATVRLTVLDSSDDSLTHYAGPVMDLSGNSTLYASVVLVAPSPDGTTAHVAYTLGGSGSAASAGVALWSGGAFGSGVAVGSGTFSHPNCLINLGGTDACLIVTRMIAPTNSIDTLVSFVLSGTTASDEQDIETGGLAGLAHSTMAGMGASYSAGGANWKIGVPIPHASGTYTNNYIPAGLIGTFNGSTIAWDAAVELESGSDVGSHASSPVSDDLGNWGAVVPELGGFTFYWPGGDGAGVFGPPYYLRRATYVGGVWSSSDTVYDLSSSGVIEGVDLWNVPFGGGSLYAGEFGYIWATTAGLMIHPNYFDFDLPDNPFGSPYVFASVLSANRWYAI